MQKPYTAHCANSSVLPMKFSTKEDAFDACMMAADSLRAYLTNRKMDVTMTSMLVPDDSMRLSLSWGPNGENTMVWYVHPIQETENGQSDPEC